MINAWLAILTYVGAYVVVVTLFLLWFRRDRIRHAVWANLDDAFDSGQFMPDGYCYGMTSREIARDMTIYAADCECYTPEQIYPHVKSWARAKS